MSIWGDDLDGRKYNNNWDYGSTEVRPPADYRWHHSEVVFGQGKDVVHSDYDFNAEQRAIRLAWLDQFDMEITIEGAYRVWKWYDGEQTCRWSERRPASAPLPKTPGFWPSDE